MVIPLLPAPGGDGEEALARLAFTHPRLLVGGVEVGEAEPPRGGADVGDGAGEARELAADAAAYELGSRGGGGDGASPCPRCSAPWSTASTSPSLASRALRRSSPRSAEVLTGASGRVGRGAPPEGFPPEGFPPEGFRSARLQETDFFPGFFARAAAAARPAPGAGLGRSPPRSESAGASTDLEARSDPGTPAAGGGDAFPPRFFAAG